MLCFNHHDGQMAFNWFSLMGGNLSSVSQNKHCLVCLVKFNYNLIFTLFLTLQTPASKNKQNLWSISEKCFISKNYTLWFNWTNCTDFVNAIKDYWFILAKLLTKGTMRLDLAPLAMRLPFQILRCADFAIFDPFFSFRRVEEISMRSNGMHKFRI